MGFKRLESEDFVVSAQSQTSTCWSNNIPTLDVFFTQSSQINNNSSGKFYLTVYDENPISSSNAQSQFEIAYGNSMGGGTLDYNNIVPGKSYSSTIYGQYRTLILEDENSSFNFGGVTGSSIYIISIDRARYKQSLFPGSLSLILSGSNNKIELTDNSNMVQLPNYYGTSRAYQIISGTLGKAYNSSSGGQGYTTTKGSYGLFLPDISTLILNGDALDLNNNEGINLQTSTLVNSNGNNPIKLFEALKLGEKFSLNSEETITSNYIFIRTRNSEFNYSENPSYISGSTGQLYYNYFINNPQTYITTIGLYNDNNDLLAVAKLSKPLNKDFTKEALIRTRIDF